MHQSTDTGDYYFGAAEELLLKPTLWRSWFGPSEEERHKLAIDYFTKAGNLYIISKDYRKAGNSFKKAATLELISSYHSSYRGAEYYRKASEAYAKVDKGEARQCLQDAIRLYLDGEGYPYAAKQSEILGDMNSTTGRVEEAIQCYVNASDYYRCANTNFLGSKCLLKAAYLSVENGDYAKAIAYLEDVITVHSDRNTYSLDKLYFELGLIHIHTGDVVAARKILEKYTLKLLEYNTLDKIVLACETFDIDMFTRAVIYYDDMHHLLGWKLYILNEIKTKLIGDITEKSDDLR